MLAGTLLAGTLLAGTWYDGRSSRPRPVRLRLATPGTIAVETEDGMVAWWPAAEIDLSPRLGSAPRLLRREGYGHIECPDSALLEQWLPGRSSRIEAFADWLERHRLAIAAAAVFTVLATVAFVRWGVPAIAKVVAERMPVAVERLLSAQVVELLERFHMDPSGLSAERRAALERAFAGLVAGEPRSGQMRLRFARSSSIGANAFALPDGSIYLTDALVDLAQDDEELLAVLAHEAGHHVYRHGMRIALESSSVLLLTGMLFGDVSGSSLAVAIPAALLNSGFSRGHEREADAYAFDLLKRRGHSPRAFARMLARLERAHGAHGSDGVLGYLSTHPPSPQRMAAAEAAAQP